MDSYAFLIGFLVGTFGLLFIFWFFWVTDWVYWSKLKGGEK